MNGVAVHGDKAGATERLLAAWRGEVQARAQYEILADRMRDPRRAEVIRKIAEAEGRHRERVERRMRELGIAIPNLATAHLSWLQRTQAKLAPVTRVMARMEAAEQDEIKDRYERSTGGAAAVVTAGVVSLVAHFLVGAAKSLFTLRTWWSAGLEMTAAGVWVGGITYAVGLVLH